MRFAVEPEPPSSPEQRVRLVYEMFELAERLVADRMRRDDPAITAEALAARLGAWRVERPGAERGDGEGRSVPWPRR